MAKEVGFSRDEILRHVLPTPTVSSKLSDAEKIEQLEIKFREVMEILGLDLANDSLQETPKRLAKMYVGELFSGLDPDKFPRISTIENDMKYDQMVLVKDISILSVCEHHFATIHGKATIAYIPGRRVIGLSKINRIAHYFSRRPQVQERMTKQIADCLEFVLETSNVAVHIDARHYCVISRGVEDRNSSTVTSDLRGVFKSASETRGEFLQHCY
jgi:GTP cyclohydrolase I